MVVGRLPYFGLELYQHSMQDKKEKKSPGLVFVFANAILFLSVSLFFLFGTLLEIHHRGSEPRKIVGIELLISKEHSTSVKSAWLFAGLWVACFLLSTRTLRTRESNAYGVVLSVAAAILFINAIQAVEIIPPDAQRNYASSYYIVLGAIFVNASIGYIGSIVQNPKPADSQKTDNQIHINIINDHGVGKQPVHPENGKHINK